jgi:clan AA aspartic protease
MMVGTVNHSLEPIVPLRVFDSGSQAHDVPVLVDSGFTHFLTLPPDLITALGLTAVGNDRLRRADGTVMLLKTFLASIEWDGLRITILVHELDGTPLIGTNLLLGRRLLVEFWDGGIVEIERRP